MNREMIHIKQQSGVFCDSFVASNTTGILFASFWGRNTSLQQFLARMELPSYEGGIDELTFDFNNNNSETFVLGDTKNFQKTSGRIQGTIYGKDLSQIFIYDKTTTSIDFSNHKAIILYLDSNQIEDKAIWQLIKEISPIPLLDLWSDQVIDTCHRCGYIDHLKGFGSVSALIVDLNADEFEYEITKMIKLNILFIDKEVV